VPCRLLSSSLHLETDHRLSEIISQCKCRLILPSSTSRNGSFTFVERFRAMLAHLSNPRWGFKATKPKNIEATGTGYTTNLLASQTSITGFENGPKTIFLTTLILENNLFALYLIHILNNVLVSPSFSSHFLPKEHLRKHLLIVLPSIFSNIFSGLFFMFTRIFLNSKRFSAFSWYILSSTPSNIYTRRQDVETNGIKNVPH